MHFCFFERSFEKVSTGSYVHIKKKLVCDVSTALVFFVRLIAAENLGIGVLVSPCAPGTVILSTGRYIISGSENCFFYIWRKQMDFLNVSRFSSTRKDRNNCWEAIKAHDAVVTVALFLPASENLLLDPHRRHSRRHGRRPGMEFIVSADCSGCLRVFRNRAPVTQTITSSRQSARNKA
ncbi:unnamed protein product [Hymenolepis diminuta]|uniref:WD_REPEATS_REGION domain-containing protein n=1 Tax=Hymenolepis diminuta TaxID=6216 RepID=A0A0R3SUF3_HYMDI|nr:unnamed protein product [Hymenolepis diminuta]